MDLSHIADARAALVRRDFGLFCQHALAPQNFRPATHHRLLIAKLQSVAEGRCRRLMVCMPPGSAKSSFVSQLFPAWYPAFKRDQDRRNGFVRERRACMVTASHTSDLAESMARKAMAIVRDNAAELGYGLATESVKGWETTCGDEFKPAGVAGPITGRRAEIALIDDPVKDRKTADSTVERETAWNWYTSTLLSRMKPGGAVVVVMTRWHEDDLGGRLLATQRDQWDVISLPAQAVENDPLGRVPGEWLWADDDYGYAADLQEKRAEYERSGAMRDWGALFQQDPKPSEGALFKVANIGIVPAIPPYTQIVRAWDLAATEQMGTRDPDWTAGVKMAKLSDGRFCICDVARERGGPDDTSALILGTTQQDGRAVKVGLPQDPGQAGKFQVAYLTRQLAGHRVESSPESGDKATRAGPFAAQVNVGNVVLLGDENGQVTGWGRRFLDELASFPSGTKDDQVDAASRAFMMLTEKRGPIRISAEAMRRMGAGR